MKEIIVGETTIGIYVADRIWEVYYRRENHSWQFAFGVPICERYSVVVQLAIDNISQYEDLFD